MQNDDGIPQAGDFGVHQPLELSEGSGDGFGREFPELLVPPVFAAPVFAAPVLVPSRLAQFPFARAPIATSVRSPSLLTPSVVRPSLLSPFLRSPGFAEHADGWAGKKTGQKNRYTGRRTVWVDRIHERVLTPQTEHTLEVVAACDYSQQIFPKDSPCIRRADVDLV